MLRIQRTVVGLLVIAALALSAAPAMAGGGISPPDGSLVFTASKQLSVTIMLDPHNNSTSPGHGVIVLRRKGYKEVEALFQAQLLGSLGLLQLGCDLSLTDARFVNRNPAGLDVGNYAPMRGYILAAVVTWLFSRVDIVAGDALQPGISQVTSQQCIQQTPDGTVTNPGYLLLEGDIGFWAVPGAPIPK